MKYLVILLTAFFSLPILAQETLVEKGNTYFQEGKYKEAISAYEEALSSDMEAADLYYNLGNAYYKEGRVASAILNYERALLLNPQDRDAQYNLELAQSHVVDKIEEVDVFFFSKWVKGLIKKTNSNTWSWIAMSLFWVFLGFAALFVFGRASGLRKLGFVFGILFLACSLSANYFAGDQKERILHRNGAIIFAPTVTVKSSPDKSGTELFVLHEGTKVFVKESLGEWLKIQLIDGNEGWISKDKLVEI